MTERLTAAQTAARLGVRTETLYAYVSRGLISASGDPADPPSTCSKSSALRARAAVRRRRRTARRARPGPTAARSE